MGSADEFQCPIRSHLNDAQATRSDINKTGKLNKRSSKKYIKECECDPEYHSNSIETKGNKDILYKTPRQYRT